MAGHLRQFVTSPLPIFDLEFASETRTPPPLIAAAKCLALCIKVCLITFQIYSLAILSWFDIQLAPGDDLVMSNMYSLLNYISATSKDIHDTSQIMNDPLRSSPIHATPQSVEQGLRGLSEDEKRLVGISTIAVVTRLALEFKMEEVMVSPL
jgi:phosphatidylinositol 4-kinase